MGAGEDGAGDRQAGIPRRWPSSCSTSAVPAPLPAGERANPRGLDYNQAQQRVIDQTEPVGHAVRAMYMYSGMADVAALDRRCRPTSTPSTRIWTNTVTKKLYITGGIGASGVGEAFGSHYQLPNLTAYNETCASVGMDYWNHRLFLLARRRASTST